MIAYQIGALQAMAAYAGLKVTHLKPHGALNNMAAEDLEYALAIGRAIKAVDRNIVYVALPGTEMETAARKLELPLAREGFADRQYDDNGNLASRSIPGTVLKDPAKAVEQVLRMVREGEIVSRNGKTHQGPGRDHLRARRRADRGRRGGRGAEAASKGPASRSSRSTR